MARSAETLAVNQSFQDGLAGQNDDVAVHRPRNMGCEGELAVIHAVARPQSGLDQDERNGRRGGSWALPIASRCSQLLQPSSDPCKLRECRQRGGAAITCLSRASRTAIATSIDLGCAGARPLPNPP